MKNPSTGFCQSCRYMNNNHKLNIWVPNGLVKLTHKIIHHNSYFWFTVKGTC